MQFPLERPEYSSPPLARADLLSDPVTQLVAWLEEAGAAENPLPEAMCLSTVGEDGGPTSRMVLLKGLQPEGLDFFTCLKSAKAAHLTADPRACGGDLGVCCYKGYQSYKGSWWWCINPGVGWRDGRGGGRGEGQFSHPPDTMPPQAEVLPCMGSDG